MRSPAGDEPYPYALAGEVEAAAGAPRRGAGEWVAAHAAHAAHAGEAGVGEPPPAVIRLAPLFAAVLDDLEAGAAAGAVGAGLHATVAAFVLDVCRRVRAATGLSVVAMAGGVFQNRLLADECEAVLAADGFEMLAAGLVPVNDGGVALGQAAVADYKIGRA